MKVVEILQNEVRKLTIDKNQSIKDALSLMDKHNVSMLLCMSDEKLVGMITERDIADRLGSSRVKQLSPSRIHVSGVMTYNPRVINSNMSIEEAAELMDRYKVSGLPVVDENELVGFISQNEILELCTKFTTFTIKEMMSEVKIQINPMERLIHARKLMFENKFGSLLVIEDMQPVGVISEGTLARAFANFRESVPARHQEERIRYLLVQDAMKQLNEHITPESTIADAANLMLKLGVRALPVLSQVGSLNGIITKGDLTRFVANGFKLSK
ncbi:MAG: CBS domain-containing protein [Promethearchaeota archaeon]|nr:MAG: CBS domain-containing protein [Candidatus Lokiarchaeota archaeon]